MTQVFNDPSLWPDVEMFRIMSYFIVIASIAVIYDWALTFDQELELVWRQRWSLMTFLYLGVRYVGLLFSAINILTLPSIWLGDLGCAILNFTLCWMVTVVNAMMGVIVIARLHAIYQRTTKILIFLIVSFLPFAIFNLGFAVWESTDMSWEEAVISGTYQCTFTGYNPLMPAVGYILGVIWEFIALCLAIRIFVIHFRELQRTSTRWTFADCFGVLMKTHVFYFAAYAAASFITISILSPTVSDLSPVEAAIYSGVLTIIEAMQMFVLGPRLILSVRQYHAELVADSDAGTAMTSIAFGERVHVTTSSGV